jgi:hypothetical protein
MASKSQTCSSRVAGASLLRLERNLSSIANAGEERRRKAMVIRFNIFSFLLSAGKVTK